MNAVYRTHHAPPLVLQTQFLAQSQRNSDRCRVIWMNQADDVVELEHRKRIVQRRLGAFRCEAVAPSLTRERPCDLQPRPALGIEQADSPDKLATRLLLALPQPIAAQLPMAEVRRHHQPRLGASLWLAVAEILHHFRVGAETRERVEIARPELPEQQPSGFEGWNRDHRRMLSLFT